MTSIGYRAFYNTGYYKDDANWDRDGALYIGNHLIEVKETISGPYSVRPNTKTIAGGAFYKCNSITEIEIPASVTSIGVEAFRGCSGLTKIDIPDSVISIGDYAFNGCSNLTEIDIPDSVTSIGGYAFAGCSNLKAVIFGENSQLNDIYYGVCERCDNLEKVFYGGTKSEWENVYIMDSENTTLENATLYYYSASKPTEQMWAEYSYYWHRVNGEVVEWQR